MDMLCLILAVSLMPATTQGDRYSPWVYVGDATVTPPSPPVVTPPPPPQAIDLSILRALRDALNVVLGETTAPQPVEPLITVTWGGSVWTFNMSQEVLCDGSYPNGYARGSEYLVVSGRLYLKGLDGHWWERNTAASSWIDRGTVKP